MTWGEYFIVLGSCMVTMLACRCIPLLALKGRYYELYTGMKELS